MEESWKMNSKVKEWILYGIWVCLYILCVGLGTVEHVEGFGKVLFFLTGLIFFLPGICLLIMGFREKRKNTVLRVRIISVCSLALTVVLFCANVMAVSAGSSAGAVLNDLLNVVSAPMFCMQYWIISIFCWACLLSASLMKFQNKKA